MQGFLNFSFKEPQLSNISLISVKLVAFFLSLFILLILLNLL